MSGTGDAPVSATGAAVAAEAVAVDAAVTGAETANLAAQQAVQSAVHIAEQAAQITAEHAAQVEQRVEVALSAQEGSLEWLTEQTRVQGAQQAELSSRLQMMEQGQQTTANRLEEILARLTPPPSPEPEVPQTDPQSVAEDARREAEKVETPKGRARHRSI